MTKRLIRVIPALLSCIAHGEFIGLLHHANTEAEGFEPEGFDEVWLRDESGKLVRQEANEDDVKEGE